MATVAIEAEELQGLKNKIADLEHNIPRIIYQAVADAMRGKPQKEWISAKEVATLMNRKDERTVREKIVNGEWNIKYKHRDGKYSFNLQSVHNFINQHTV